MPTQPPDASIGRELSDLEIRLLQTLDEYRQCVALQIETWECPEECVPPAVLQVSQKLGGLAAGAFDRSGRLLGFVFGLTGWRGDELCHWSDMLAVRRELRDFGIGHRLKEFQRARLLERGVNVMYWTFDPLVARNAHLNLEKLGARVAEYIPNMYGSGDSSVLDTGTGTDRFIVRWKLNVEPGTRGCRYPDGDYGSGRKAPFPDDSAIVNRPGESTAVQTPRSDHGRPVSPIHIEIPSDIESLQARDAALAVAWRQCTREAFCSYLDRGYTVDRFIRSPTSHRCVYLLLRPTNRGPSA